MLVPMLGSMLGIPARYVELVSGDHWARNCQTFAADFLTLLVGRSDPTACVVGVRCQRELSAKPMTTMLRLCRDFNPHSWITDHLYSSKWRSFLYRTATI